LSHRGRNSFFWTNDEPDLYHQQVRERVQSGNAGHLEEYAEATTRNQANRESADCALFPTLTVLSVLYPILVRDRALPSLH
jgi:hypothetical protein